ncbi:MAG TPA: aldose 1-epimerase family protein [Flavitalea sp.]|nr:aldose 1-epimerase family protein [Flavitalea sp.]
MEMISNEFLNVSIRKTGAELTSIFHNRHQLEYMWQADPVFWAKHSPLLFPIVGTLRNNAYNFNGRNYTLPRHGFARDLDFQVESIKETEAVYLLRSSNQTIINYPFEFELRVYYSLHQESLRVGYTVKNLSSDIMYFSIGAHPAFRLPLIPGTVYEDYYLEFDTAETVDRWPITADGLISVQPKEFLKKQPFLPLTPSLFHQDAIVLKHMKSEKISICSDKTDRRITMDFKGFPYYGIWAAKNAPFICLEPWCGIADSENSSGKLNEKEGIIFLNPDEIFERSWKVTCN